MIKTIGLEITPEEENAIRKHMHDDESSNNSLQAIVRFADQKDVSEFHRFH